MEVVAMALVWRGMAAAAARDQDGQGLAVVEETALVSKEDTWVVEVMEAVALGVVMVERWEAAGSAAALPAETSAEPEDTVMVAAAKGMAATVAVALEAVAPGAADAVEVVMVEAALVVVVMEEVELVEKMAAMMEASVEGVKGAVALAVAATVRVGMVVVEMAQAATATAEAEAMGLGGLERVVVVGWAPDWGECSVVEVAMLADDKGGASEVAAGKMEVGCLVAVMAPVAMEAAAEAAATGAAVTVALLEG